MEFEEQEAEVLEDLRLACFHLGLEALLWVTGLFSNLREYLEVKSQDVPVQPRFIVSYFILKKCQLGLPELDLFLEGLGLPLLHLVFLNCLEIV